VLAQPKACHLYQGYHYYSARQTAIEEGPETMKKIRLFSALLCSGVLALGCGGSEATDTNPVLTTVGQTDSGTTGMDEDTGGTSGATTTTTGMTSGNFVTSDSAVSCGTMCDPWMANNCPAGEKCTAVACEVGSTAWDSNVCVPVMGDKALGDECQYLGGGIDGLDDCAEGLMCWDQNPDTGLGVCIEFCSGSPTAPSCPGGQGFCTIANNGTLPICLPECDPLSPACPNPDNLCLPSPDDLGFICVLNASQDMAPYGTPCQYANSCNHNLLCISSDAVPEASCAGATSCCSPICDTTQPNTCPGTGQECIAWWEAGTAPPNYETIGVCAVPA
jgi:hypothetical protein